MAFQFYIDGLLADQPLGDKIFTKTIKRDSGLKALLVSPDREVTLEWTKKNTTTTGITNMYDYLDALFRDGVCNEAEIEVYDQVDALQTYLLHKGIIKISQLEYDEQRVNIKVKIQDNSYYAYIHNNKDLKVDLRANQTKNKVVLAPIDAYAIDFFNSLTGAYGSSGGALYEGYRIYDVIEFIVAAITDNKVGFRSDYLTALDPHPFLIKGQALLNPYTLFPTAQQPVYEISFREVFTELDKIMNLSFYIDDSDPNNPVLVLEDTEHLYGANGGYSFTDIKHLKTTVDVPKLYGQVSVGSRDLVDGVDPAIYTFSEATSYYGWKIETFFPLGQCNISAELDLVNGWALSNNVILDTVIGLSTQYIDTYFLVECTSIDTTLLTASAKRYPYFGTSAPPYFYNFGTNNYTKMQRHSDKFESSFGSFLNVGGNGFRALLGDDPGQDITYNTGSVLNPNFIPPGGLLVPIAYVNETTSGGYDGGNNYNNGTFQYTLPVDGDYTFQHKMYVESSGLAGSFFGDEFQVSPNIYLNGVIANSTGFSPQINYDGVFELTVTAFISGVAGDIVTADYDIAYQPNGVGNQQIARQLTVTWESFFEANGTPEGGIAISGNQARKLLHEFEYPISPADFRTILANVTGFFPFEKDGITRIGWIEQLTYNIWNQRALVKLISQNATV